MNPNKWNQVNAKWPIGEFVPAALTHLHWGKVHWEHGFSAFTSKQTDLEYSVKLSAAVSC